MSAEPSSLQLALDLVGVFVFALSGALLAVRRGFDLFGILVLAWLSGLGGGIMRDVMLGRTPPDGISDARLLGAALAAGLAIFALDGPAQSLMDRNPDVRWRRFTLLIRTLDAVGLAVFAVSGALVALAVGVGPLTATIIGGVTAVGGGLLRDVVAGRVPEVLQRELYAIPALAGAALVVLADHLEVLSPATAGGAALLVFVTRMLAVALNLNAPRALRSGT